MDKIWIRHWLKSRKGSVADVLSAGICVLAMTVVMIAYTGNIQLLHGKAQIDQIVRRYLLRMETVGYLTEEDRLKMSQELSALGAAELDFSGSTMNSVGYGEKIILKVRGKIPGNTLSVESDLFCTVSKAAMYEFGEQRTSTAKH